MKKIFKYFRNRFCKHTDLLIISNIVEHDSGSYNVGSIAVCKNCGKILKTDRLYKTDVINFIPRSDYKNA